MNWRLIGSVVVVVFVGLMAAPRIVSAQSPAPYIAPDHCCILAIEEGPETLVCNSVTCYPPNTSGCFAQGRTASSSIVGSTCKFSTKELCKLHWVSTQLDVYRCATDFTSCTAPMRKCTWEYNSAGEMKGHYQCDAGSSICGF